MNDLSDTLVAKSDQLTADDLIGRTLTINVLSVSKDAGAEQPVSISFGGDEGKPYKPCKIMRRLLVQCWGKDGNAYVGRGMTLYRDPDVMFGALKVGGIRISHLSHIDGEITLALTEKKGRKKGYKVKPLALSKSATAPVADKAEQWLARLSAALDKAQTVDDVHALMRRADVQINLSAEAPQAFRDRINASFDAALKRFEPQDTDDGDLLPDDGWPGPDVPAMAGASTMNVTHE